MGGVEGRLSKKRNAHKGENVVRGVGWAERKEGCPRSEFRRNQRRLLEDRAGKRSEKFVGSRWLRRDQRSLSDERVANRCDKVVGGEGWE